MHLTAGDTRLLAAIARDPTGMDYRTRWIPILSTDAQKVAYGLIGDPVSKDPEVLEAIRGLQEWAAKPRRPKK